MSERYGFKAYGREIRLVKVTTVEKVSPVRVVATFDTDEEAAKKAALLDADYKALIEG